MNGLVSALLILEGQGSQSRWEVADETPLSNDQGDFTIHTADYEPDLANRFTITVYDACGNRQNLERIDQRE